MRLLFGLPLFLFQKKLHYPFESKSEEIFFFLKNIGIPVLAGCILLLLLIILRDKWILRKRNLTREKISVEFHHLLNNVFSNKLDKQVIFSFVSNFKRKIHLKKLWVKSIVMHQLLEAEELAKNHIRKEKLLLVYRNLDFHKYSEKLLNNKSWYYKALGIYHYQIIGYTLKKSSIEKLLNSKNKHLQSNALIAILSFTEDKFSFLETYDNKISKTDILKIVDLLSKEAKLPLKIKDWFYSNHASLQIIALKLSVHFKYSIPKKYIYSMLQSDNSEVRMEISETIFQLCISGLSKNLVNTYRNESIRKNQLSLIRALSVSGSEASERFLIDLLATEKDPELLFEITNAVYKYDQNYLQSEFENMELTNNKELIYMALKHIQEPLLNR